MAVSESIMQEIREYLRATREELGETNIAGCMVTDNGHVPLIPVGYSAYRLYEVAFPDGSKPIKVRGYRRPWRITDD